MCYGEAVMRAFSFAVAALAAFVSLVARPSGALAAEPVGADNCKACHETAYKQWKDSQHARSLESLSPRQQKDGRCLSCHAPQSGRGLKEVSCETCHGGGQYYTPTYVMKDKELARAVGLEDPSERLCSKCHDSNAPSLKPFNFVERLKLIDHWSAEREARKAAKTGR
jgi:formate-dependent nitrite reductase cytochrome c552 subunit